MTEKENVFASTDALASIESIVSLLGRDKAPKFYYNNTDMSYWMSGKFDMLDILRIKAILTNLGLGNIVVLNQSIMNTYRKADKNDHFMGIYEGNKVRPLKE